MFRRRSRESEDDGWLVVCRRDSLREGQGQAHAVAGRSVAVFLTDGQVFAVENVCAHREVALADGSVHPGCILACSWHGWRFDLATGDHLTMFGPRRGVAAYPVRVKDGTVWVGEAEFARPPAIAPTGRPWVNTPAI